MLNFYLKRIKWVFFNSYRWVVFSFFTDYYLVGYPKTGNTWCRYFLAVYFRKIFNVPLELSFDRRITKIHKGVPRIYFSHIGTVPGHQAYLITQLDIKKVLEKTFKQLRNKKIIFLARDPRDTVVSLYFHIKRSNNLDITISEFVRDDGMGIERIVYYMNEWYKNRDKFKSFDVFRYEDRLDDPEKESLRMVNILTLPVSQEAIKSSVIESSFDKMQQIEKNRSIDHKTFLSGDANDVETYRVRKGKVGGYLEYLNEDDIEYCNEVVLNLNKVFKYNV